MRAKIMTAGIMVALVCLPAIAQADWFEYFDVYAPGSQIVGQGGWEEWGFGTGALVTDLVSQSPTNSVEIVGATDIVHRYAGYTSNKWLYKAYVYIPSDLAGQSYFILLNTYDPPNYNWSVEFSFDSSDGWVKCDCGGLFPAGQDIPIAPYVTDEWSEIRIYIDMDEDWVQIYYNGILLDDPDVPDHPTLGGGQIWTMGVFGEGGGVLNIGAVDLFANNASSVYYDDMTLAASSAWANLRVDTSSGYQIDYTVVAGRDAGIPSDTWMVLMTPNGPYTYDGLGSPLGWNSGLTPPLASGPLGNSYGTSLNIGGLPWSGSYTAHLAVDTIQNGIPSVNDVLVWETESFTVP